MSRTLFVGDVHGCAEELGLLVQETQPTRVVLVGDLFTRGPDPAGVWQLIRAHRMEAVLGNHDADVLARWKPDRKLPREAFRWLSDQPWMRRGRGWVCVHAGVHPRKGADKTRRKHAMNLRQWPDDKRADNPRWWQLYWGNELVIHGHDPVTGLNDRRPFTLGLDTACVRGRALTGFLLEHGAIVSVPATARTRAHALERGLLWDAVPQSRPAPALALAAK